MSAQEYILKQLERLKEPATVSVPDNNEKIAEYIFKSLTSKKFRKVSLPDENITCITKEIQERLSKKEPILIQFPFGAYKLWRLEESPNPDWAELFSLMYYIRWVKGVCAVYKPGVRFVFHSDEIAIPKLNNVPESDLKKYQESLEELFLFLKSYMPSNMSYEIFRERERFESYEQFEKEWLEQVEIMREDRKINPFEIPEAEKSAIETNVKLVQGQDENPNWIEEVNLLHYGYYQLQAVKKHPRKHYEEQGIVAFCYMFETPNIIAVGSTKTSTAKFWVGVGALKKRGDSYIETVLSISQLEKGTFQTEAISIPGLDGDNFSKIRICK